MMKKIAAGMVTLFTAGLLAAAMGSAVAAHKVTICHKGKTKSVSMRALPAHEAHGDTIGACD